jgi:hypothetical protein
MNERGPVPIAPHATCVVYPFRRMSRQITRPSACCERTMIEAAHIRCAYTQHTQPCHRLSTQYGLLDIACHVIQRSFNPRLLDYIVSYSHDAASSIRDALGGCSRKESLKLHLVTPRVKAGYRARLCPHIHLACSTQRSPNSSYIARPIT